MTHKAARDAEQELEWLDGPEIQALAVSNSFEGYGGEYYRVGQNGVTRIQRIERSGMHSNLPYVRVWKDDHECLAEFSLHSCVGIYFDRQIDDDTPF